MTGETLRAIRATMRSSDLSTMRADILVDQYCGSYSSLLRLFREEGTSFRAEINRERKRRIENMLSVNPHVSADEMMDACGFAFKQNLYKSWPIWFGGTYTQTQGTRTVYVERQPVII